MAALLKAVHEFAESAAQEPAGTGTAEALAQLAEEANDATLPGPSGCTLSDAAKNFGDLVPVLIARDRE
jgi:hypothetical protein